MKNDIKFGTDGWRGISGFDFTEEKVRLISLGVCNYLKKKILNKTPAVVIGFDTRFLSDRFAASAAEVFNLNGIKTCLSDGYITSPALSGAVVNLCADLGIMITASHNPFFYNGYKIKGSFGGSATMDIIAGIEAEVNSLKNCSKTKNHLKAAGSRENSGGHSNDNKNGIKICDINPVYKKNVLDFVDTDIIKKKFNFPVVLDPMYGAGQGLFKQIISPLSKSEVFEIHGSVNASFGNINPEPIGSNLDDAIKALKDNKCAIALCLDGDGDRIGAVGENGNFVSSHHIFAIVLDYLLRCKKLAGRVIKTVSTSSIIDRICAAFGIELVTKPVGFKYIGEEILSGDVIMGGEESGGLWVKGYIPERDGIIMSLVLLEILCREDKTVNEILKEIYNSYGFFLYRRCDYEIEAEKKQRLKAALENKIPDVLQSEGARQPVKIDGFKYFFEDKSWIMIRPSGTEAVVRIYAESDTSKKLDYLHELGKKLIENC